MKNFFALTMLCIIFSACSDDDLEIGDDLQNVYPKTVNIEFEFTSDITTGFGQLATIVENGTVIIEDKSSLGRLKEKIQKFTPMEVNKGTQLKITYEDFSEYYTVGDYNPYNIDMKIIVDDEIVQSKTILLSEINMTEFLVYEFK